MTARPPVVVVGAGMAGLAAATRIARAGRTVRILEAATRPGGRVGGGTERGFVVDDGFQVLFPAYPHLNRLLAIRELDLRPVDRGAWIRDTGGRWGRLMDPRQDPLALGQLVTAPWRRLPDALALGRLTLLAFGNDATRQAGSTADLLQRVGISEELLEAFFKPFFGGVQLSDTLEAAAADMLVAWRMLALGGAALPARGMQAVADQLAAGCGAPVETGIRVTGWLTSETGRITGVQTADGRKLEADGVILACAPPEWRSLLPECRPPEGRPAFSIHVLSDRALVPGRRLLLGRPADTFRVACPVSAVASAYAPAGQHQTVFQLRETEAGADPESWLRATLADLAPGIAVKATVEACHSSATAQFIREPDPQWPAEPRPGLYLATDAQVRSSIDGALAAGLEAADRLLARDSG
ncbi:MAG: FAD-dependent oxidoreductase [Candidatus Sericytochromatia bacterium]|nr:FAD-dependent oxidoreductase [Candidatus Sericytochromatia bacterium]